MIVLLVLIFLSMKISIISFTFLQDWRFLSPKNWRWIFWMVSQRHFGKILREPPQTSTIMYRWQSMLNIMLLCFSIKCSLRMSMIVIWVWFRIEILVIFLIMTLMVFSSNRHTEEWAMVASCTRITEVYCDLSGLIHDYRTAYKVKVQLVAGMNESAWTMKRFLPSRSKNIRVSSVYAIVYDRYTIAYTR